MAGFYAASDYTKCGFLVILAGGLLLVIAILSPFWVTDSSGHGGIWLGCVDGGCYDRYNMWVEPWIRACQAFTSMALVTWAGGTLAIFAYIYHRYFDEDKRIVLLSVISTYASALFTFLSVVIWAGGQYMGTGQVLNWAYAFACVNCLCSAVAATFFLLELKRPQKQ